MAAMYTTYTEGIPNGCNVYISTHAKLLETNCNSYCVAWKM